MAARQTCLSDILRIEVSAQLYHIYLWSFARSTTPASLHRLSVVFQPKGYRCEVLVCENQPKRSKSRYAALVNPSSKQSLSAVCPNGGTRWVRTSWLWRGWEGSTSTSRTSVCVYCERKECDVVETSRRDSMRDSRGNEGAGQSVKCDTIRDDKAGHLLGKVE